METGRATVKVVGRGAGRAFRHETGNHVVQRVPPTERNGRRQTSVVTVAVLPLPPKRSYVPLPEREIETKTQTGKQGAGGQNVNKVASAVRMKHVPTGISVFINGRDQHQNRADALEILTARVNETRNRGASEAYAADRMARLKGRGTEIGGRGDKVRTYNFIRGEIVDHRLGTSTTDMKRVMRGDFSALFRS